jgi:hypothetical protein
LYALSLTLYEEYLTGFLKSAIPFFKRCSKDLSLSNRDDTTRIFTATLTEEEEEILSALMGIKWFEREVNRIMDIRLGLNNTDFKRASEAMNLKEKRERLKQLKEDADRLIVDYTYDNADLTTLG